jgi:hypothetical protein
MSDMPDSARPPAPVGRKNSQNFLTFLNRLEIFEPRSQPSGSGALSFLLCDLQAGHWVGHTVQQFLDIRVMQSRHRCDLLR